MMMLERVARAMDVVTTGPEAGDLVISEIFSEDLWRVMSARLARAAIEAMRLGPLEFHDLTFAAKSIRLLNDDITEGGWSNEDWNAMIDSALAGPIEPPPSGG